MESKETKTTKQMITQISTFFSGLKSGKSRKNKKSHWYDGDLNESAEYDEDDINPTYFSCLGKSGSSSESNSRQRRNIRVASTQSLDKIGKQKSKNQGTIRGATSMLDLNSNKKNKQQSLDFLPQADLGIMEIIMNKKNSFKSGLKNKRLGFGKFKEKEHKVQNDDREIQKKEKWKLNASIRRAYKNGKIAVDSNTNVMPKVNIEERFVINKSSKSSSSSQNISNEIKQICFHAAPEKYSPRLSRINDAQPNIWDVPPNPSNAQKRDSLCTSAPLKNNILSEFKDKENKANEFRKSRIRLNSFQYETDINPSPQTPLKTNSNNQCANRHNFPYHGNYNFPPTTPALTQNRINQKINNEGLPFSPLIRKKQSSSDQKQSEANKIHFNNGYLSKIPRTITRKSTYIGGSCLDIANLPNNLERFHSRPALNQIKESHYVAIDNQRKVPVKVEDLVQRMSLFEMKKSPQGPVFPTPPQKCYKIDIDQQDCVRKHKDNPRSPSVHLQQQQDRLTSRVSKIPVIQVSNKTTNVENNDCETDILTKDPKLGITYSRGKLLGKGGFARCYEMKDLKNQIIYAGKIMAKRSLEKDNQTAKISREIDLHFRLSHKNIVGFQNYFEDIHSVYIILELCSRKSLVHLLKKRRTLTEPEVRYYMKHLTNGVQYIHSQKIIHRDLKLGNMLLNSTMELKIADFGLATKVEYEGEKKISFCGTPNYLAPELLQKAGYSYEVDIWAMGCIMYAMLCGRPPFESSTLKETYTRICTNKYLLPQHVSMAAKSLIRHLLTAEPYLRPTLERIHLDHFFVDGFMPEELSPSTCESRPKFPLMRINLNKNVGKRIIVSVGNGDLGNIMQLKNSKKYASQVLTQTRNHEYELAANTRLREDHFIVGSLLSK